ncbi:MAG TPA: hypothetical protein PLY91_01340 [Methanoregulaceae archaeon]|nr:hypothetical protein [Methanoregulaceae archaeon]
MPRSPVRHHGTARNCPGRREHRIGYDDESRGTIDDAADEPTGGGSTDGSARLCHVRRSACGGPAAEKVPPIFG